MVFLDAAISCERSGSSRLTGATDVISSIAGINGGALILNGLCWCEGIIIQVENVIAWEDELPQKTVLLLSTATAGYLVSPIQESCLC